jgi:alkanesulfonate monooxygenase SsuD/methylene tetrahydromethanopterin reductase-like flavin-dependent oxidoreductase (luciferase family)
MPGPKIGITLPADGRLGHGGVTAVARRAEELGFESVWTPDVLTGDGEPALEAIVALTAAAAVTERVGIGFCTLVLPARPLPLTAAQLQALQQVSGNRLLLGIGSGGFPDSQFWRASGIPAAGRGRRTDVALDALPGLIGGEKVELDGTPITLAPGAPVPPVLVGGNSDVALRRTVRHGDGWFPSQIGPAELADRIATLRALAAGHGRPTPGVTVGGHVIFGTGEAAATARRALTAHLLEAFGKSSEQAAAAPMPGGSAAELAERFAAYREAGADRIVTGPEHQDWERQLDLIAEARALLD